MEQPCVKLPAVSVPSLEGWLPAGPALADGSDMVRGRTRTYKCRAEGPGREFIPPPRLPAPSPGTRVPRTAAALHPLDAQDPAHPALGAGLGSSSHCPGSRCACSGT